MPGYDGFKPGYFRGLAEALVANILFQGGLFFAARVEGTTGAVLGLVWGALIAAVLVVRLRYLLHYAVLEAALEAASTGGALKDTAHGTAYCPSCEMPLMVGANFCVVCGTSVRAGQQGHPGAQPHRGRRPRDRAADGRRCDPPAGVAPQDNKKTALVVGAVVGGHPHRRGDRPGRRGRRRRRGRRAEAAVRDRRSRIDPAAGERRARPDAGGPARERPTTDARARPSRPPAATRSSTSATTCYVLVPKGFRIDDAGPGLRSRSSASRATSSPT